MAAGLDAELRDGRRWIASAEAVTVMTGAGISTDSGIPDYRGPQGVWTRDPEAEKLATLDHYLHDPEIRRRSWQNRLTAPHWSARPNPGHLALVALEHKGNLAAVVTQNVDGLHQRAGQDPAKVVELHGSVWRSRCWSCRDERDMAEALDRVRAGEEDPPCLVCGGILKSATISFGENLDPAVLERGRRAVEMAEVLVVGGSTLTVHPAAALVPLARRTADRVIIVNAEPTPYDDLADVVVRIPLSESFPALIGVPA